MCEFGILWDKNHQPIEGVPPSDERFSALVRHLKTVHREESRASVRRTLQENRAELLRLRRWHQEYRERFHVYLRRKTLWNNDLLKQLNNEGIYL